MKMLTVSKWLIYCSLFCVFCSHRVFAETIYQWTDPWGQVQYTKTPVPGSMVSELTELPDTQASTEQQKQAAMLKKIQEIKQANIIYKQKKSSGKIFSQQRQRKGNHCRKLRNLQQDVRLGNIRKYDYLNNFYAPGYYFYPGRPDRYGGYDYFPDYPDELLEKKLNSEIRDYCR